MFNLKKEPVPQSLSNGPMETDLALRKKISLRILRETPTEMPISSTRTPLTSQVLQLTLVTIPLQKTPTSVRIELLVTDI